MATPTMASSTMTIAAMAATFQERATGNRPWSGLGPVSPVGCACPAAVVVPWSLMSVLLVWDVNGFARGRFAQPILARGRCGIGGRGLGGECLGHLHAHQAADHDVQVGLPHQGYRDGA